MIIVYAINKQKADFSLLPSTQNIIMGHSHGVCAFNDSLIANTINLCSSGESYFYMYPKLKNFVENNKQITTVFIVVAANQFHKNMDESIWSDKYLTYYYASYFPFFNSTQHVVVLKNKPKNVIAALPITFKTQFKNIVSNNYSYFKKVDGFTPQKRELPLAEISNITISNTVSKDSISEVNINYLKKMVEYCQQRKLKVIFVRCPQHKSYIALQDQSMFDSVLHNIFRNIEFLDFKSYSVSIDNYADIHHLNIKGAYKFSQYFNQYIQDSLK